MNNKFTLEEAFVKKRFKKDGFEVVKLDTSNKYKAPDFKITKDNLSVLVEVKIGFKRGKIIETLSTGASRLDPLTAVEDYFRNVSEKFKDYVTNFPEDDNLPYIVVFTAPLFIDRELEWSDVSYKKYKNISAIFIPQRTHPLDKKVDKMTTEQLEKAIYNKQILFSSQTKLVWKIIKNPYASNPLKHVQFSSISLIKRPLLSAII